MPGAPIQGSSLAAQNSAATTSARGGNSVSVAQATADATAPAGAAPPGASAAAKKNPIFTGLCEALNTHQKTLVKEGKYELADIYEIEFAPASLASSKVKKPGNTNFDATTNQTPTANGQQLNPATNSVNTSSRSEPVLAGTQIIQFIDKVMRNSSYMSDQMLYITDEVTGKQVPSSNSKNGQVAWYKVSVTATPLSGFDNKRKDHAYRMKYTISPYAINQMQSEYFPKARFRGLHKLYNYWFTGQNNSILDFQQEYNNLYRLIMSGTNIPIINAQTSDPRNITKKVYMPASAQSDQGAKKGANEAAANAADYLYSPSDQAKIKLKIVGDPAWMQQGEVTRGITAKSFNFSPFNPDGGINYDSQEVVFAVQWNRPSDYNMGTGVMDVTANNVNGTPAIGVTSGSQPQESFTYTAIKVKNSFAKGRFEQEIEGRLLVEYYDNLKSSNNATTETQTASPATPNQVGGAAALPNTSSPGTATGTGQIEPGSADNTSRQALRSQASDGVITTADSPTPIQNDQSTPVSDNVVAATPPAQPVTSNGEIVGSAVSAPPKAGEVKIYGTSGATTVAASASATAQALAAGQTVVYTESKPSVNTPQIESRSP